MKAFYENQIAHQILEGVLAKESAGHAYLIHGADGLGKRHFAMQFAMSLLCEQADKPCGHCKACVKMMHGTHPDFEVIEPTGKSESITVEMVRSLRMSCAIKPNESRYKLYLIANIHRMTPGALNAFLKTLEEPPCHVVFLLTCPAMQLLTPTILSRVTPVPLFAVSDQTVRQVLQADFAQTAEELREQAVALSEGNIGKARQILSDDEFSQSRQLAIDFCNAIAKKQEYQLLLQLSGFGRDKQKVIVLLQDVGAMMRLALRDKITHGQSSACPALTQYLTQKQLLQLLEVCADGQQRLQSNANYNLSLNAIVARIGQCVN